MARRRITRRDFLDGIALGAAGLLSTPDCLSALALEPTKKTSSAPYPPALTGLRGSHPGSYETAHALRDGSFWTTAGAPESTGEIHDLVVVGGGLSGLSAAHFFRQSSPRARVLLLDNHDDFGGHAKRNEFQLGGRLRLGFGGTFAIDSPAPYSAQARGLLRELGVDVSRWSKVFDRSVYRSLGLRPFVFFDKETFGLDRLAPDPSRTWDASEDPDERVWAAFLAAAPLPAAAKADVRRLYKDDVDHLPGLSSAEKKARLARISYADFLGKLAGMDRAVALFLQARPHSLYGVGIDAVSALDAWGLGMPGFRGMGLDPGAAPGMGLDAIPNEEAESFFFHFPDGNASLARLLVRGLVPGAVPSGPAEEIVKARIDYGRLDEPSAAARIRLNSTVVRVKHVGSEEIEVAYVQDGRLRSVRGRSCVLACWNAVIPYICPELPEAQRHALADSTKVPIVYTNVLVREWSAFRNLGAYSIHAPGSYHSSVSLDMPVSVGGYQCSRKPQEPMVLHLVRTPCSPGLPARDQHRAGRAELFTTPFEVLERRTRDQLGRMLGAGGFDAERDIAAITVNRWPHGYAYQYNSLWDEFWLEGRLDEQPCVLGRKPFGRIAIANADAGAYAYTDGAIDQAYRAVEELRGAHRDARPAAARPGRGEPAA